MNTYSLPESSVATARRIVRSWVDGSNTILVCPPLTDPTAMFDLLTDVKFYAECGVDPKSLSVAKFRAGRIESPQSFIKGVVAQWDPEGALNYDGIDVGGDLSKALKAVFDSYRIPVLLIEAFHQAVRALTWDVGTALRELQHGMKLRTVIELPVKLSTLRSRWIIEKDAHDFLASEFGQGHSTLILKGYTDREVTDLAASRGLTEKQIVMILDQTGGVPDLANWLIRESQYCESPVDLIAVSEGGATDICYRFLKWLDAPGETSFLRTLSKMYHGESLNATFATINHHEWSTLLLNDVGFLRANIIGYAAARQLKINQDMSADLLSNCHPRGGSGYVGGYSNGDRQTILVAATCWGVKHGGINSFNLGLCSSLVSSGAVKYRVVCIVPTNCDVVEDSSGMDVIALREDGESKFYSFDVKLALDFLRDYGPIKYVIGHDLITGDFACALAAEVGAKSLVFCHMSYAAYYSMMNTSEQSNRKVETQRKLLSRADAIFAVGPKLVKHAKSLLRISTSKAPVYEYIPDLLSHEPVHSARDIPCITYVGRLGNGAELVKQGLLAVKAIGVAIKQLNLRDAMVRVVGSADNQDEDEYKSIINEAAGKLVSTEFLSFQESRSETLKYIFDSSLVVMPSVHDGFGLVGWEAISLGIPLVISENTGLYEYLTELGVNGYVGGVDILGSMAVPRDEDVICLSARIVSKLEHPGRAHDEASLLLKKISRLHANSSDRLTESLRMAFPN